MRLLEIEAGGHAYQALVGPLEEATEQLRGLSGNQPLTAVTDETVWALHGERLNRVHPVEPLFVPGGEAAKNWSSLETLLSRFAERGLTRSTPVLAVGGGSVGDLTGLAAGLFKRGCPVVHIPTTFLGQVDSAIGGKTAIDFAGQKNVVGLFHQPAFVIADWTLLDTLDGRQMRAGYAELVKYGLIGDPPMYEFAEEAAEGILTGDHALRRRAVDTAIRCKAYYVAEDPEDRLGIRALLNFGHTFGHAVEAMTGFGPILHGEAVALGMALAFRLSVELGHCPEADSDRVTSRLRSIGLPTTLDEAGVIGRGPELTALMVADKKVDASGPRLILTRGIGKAFVANVSLGALTDFLDRAP